MDETADARGQELLEDHSNGRTVDDHRDKTCSKRYLKAAESDNPAMRRDDGDGSDFSLTSTSDDVELEHFPSENELSDEEDIKPRKNGSGRRKRRRRHQRMDENGTSSCDTTRQERVSADRTVIKALLINALLIAAWYAFSLSISIVGRGLHSIQTLLQLTQDSVQQMDVLTEIPRLSLSFVYDVPAHACSICTGLLGSLLCTASSSAEGQHYQSA